MKLGILSYSIIIAAMLLLPETGQTLPQFTTEFGQSCRLCHQNPTGGGMRNLYGAQFFSQMDLPMNPVEDMERIEDIQPSLSNSVQIGFDFRSLYYSVGPDSNGNSFLTMQGDMYLAFTPNDKALVYLDRSISGVDELFVLLQGYKQFGSVRMGKFLPAYGWRFDDHKTFVRDKLGFGALSRRPIVPDNGIEFGWFPMEWEFSAAVTNGAIGFYDTDDGKALTTRSAGRFAFGETNLTLGVSHRYGELGRSSPLLRYGGGFWGANWRKFTYMGEVDWIVDTVTSRVSTHLLSYRYRQGWDINLTYDFYDPDLDLKSGSAWRGRISSDIYLTGYLALMPAYEWNYEDTGTLVKEYGTGELQLHVWF